MMQKVIDAIQREIDAAYNRGWMAARAELLIALGDGQQKTERPAGERVRAPKGLVRQLIVRALSEGLSLTVNEIHERRTGDMERMIKIASLRTDIIVGERSGLFVRDGAKWRLAP